MERRTKNSLRTSRMQSLNSNGVKPGLAMYIQGKMQAEKMKLASIGINVEENPQRRKVKRIKLPNKDISEEDKKFEEVDKSNSEREETKKTPHIDKKEQEKSKHDIFVFDFYIFC